MAAEHNGSGGSPSLQPVASAKESTTQRRSMERIVRKSSRNTTASLPPVAVIATHPCTTRGAPGLRTRLLPRSSVRYHDYLPSLGLLRARSAASLLASI